MHSATVGGVCDYDRHRRSEPSYVSRERSPRPLQTPPRATPPWPPMPAAECAADSFATKFSRACALAPGSLPELLDELVELGGEVWRIDQRERAVRAEIKALRAIEKTHPDRTERMHAAVLDDSGRDGQAVIVIKPAEQPSGPQLHRRLPTPRGPVTPGRTFCAASMR
jgi:hypothetical protein